MTARQGFGLQGFLKRETATEMPDTPRSFQLHPDYKMRPPCDNTVALCGCR